MTDGLTLQPLRILPIYLGFLEYSFDTAIRKPHAGIVRCLCKVCVVREYGGRYIGPVHTGEGEIRSHISNTAAYAAAAAAADRLPFAFRGVLSMLDEECLLPHGTDSGFVALLQSQTQVSFCISLVKCIAMVHTRVHRPERWR